MNIEELRQKLNIPSLCSPEKDGFKDRAGYGSNDDGFCLF